MATDFYEPLADLGVQHSPLADLMVPAYYDPWDMFSSGLAHELFMMGGRNSIKSTIAGYMVPCGVMANVGVNAMVLRKHEVGLATSVYPNIKQCIEWLDEKMPEQHLSYRWDFRKDCRLMTFDGNRAIVFHGLDDPTKRKSEKPPYGGYFGYLWLEELNEFGREEVSSLRKSVLRGGRIGQTIYTFNPPRSKAEWVNAEAARPKPYRYVYRTTYLDILPYHPEWLGDTFIQEAEEARLANTLEYRHELLGEAIGTGGEIFTNIEQCEITDEQIAYFRSHGMARRGLDFGFTSDPTRLVELAVDEPNRTFWFYLSDGGHGMFEEDIAELIEKHGMTNEVIIADRAEMKAIARLRRLGVNRIRECWKDPNGWKEIGMSLMRSSRWRWKIDARPHRAKSGWDEMSRYEFDRYKNGDLHTDYPSRPKYGDHDIDACLVGETMVETPDGPRRIEEMVGTSGELYALDEKTGGKVRAGYCNCRMTRRDDWVMRIELENGLYVVCTNDHRILTSTRGWIMARMITPLDKVVTMNGSVRVKTTCGDCVRRTVYDLEVPEYHNFAVNGGIIVHNCRYAIDLDIQKHYAPKVWGVPKAYKRTYGSR